MKVFVGLSGGVDSSVAAKLLVDEGHDVTGVFIKIWQPEFLECTWKEDRLAAKRAASALGIPFLEVDLSREYKEHVINDMIAGYSAGRTPNPDVLCNRFIKFGAFRAWAKSNGAEKIATGHYAQIFRRLNGVYELHRGIDSAKDQSYFLYRLTQDDLCGSLFPIGGMMKREVRARARAWNLPSAERPDSQGLCFVGDIDVGEFLARFIPMRAGSVLDEYGRVVGTHGGCARYTIGQRHGFIMTGNAAYGGPYFVTDINVVHNAITVSDNPATARVKSAVLTQTNWIAGLPQPGIQYGVSLRYHQTPQIAHLRTMTGHTRLYFEELQNITPGQSAVVYDSERCLGGGVVNKAHNVPVTRGIIKKC